MKVSIANDHRGTALKKKIMERFKTVEFQNEGIDSDDSVDYPDYAARVAGKVSTGQCERGILICGTGIGMSISANKFPGVRAAMVWEPAVARLTRQHNDSNVLCLAGDFLKADEAFKIVDMWLKTPFEGGRHARRLEKIRQQEAARWVKKQ